METALCEVRHKKLPRKHDMLAQKPEQISNKSIYQLYKPALMPTFDKNQNRQKNDNSPPLNRTRFNPNQLFLDVQPLSTYNPFKNNVFSAIISRF